MKQLETAREVVTALGGASAVAARINRSVSAVSKMQNVFGSFPSEFYVLMNEDLAKIDCEAPQRLWRMMESGPQGEPEEEAADA